MSCFNIHTEYLRISLGYTFHPIELKLGMLPILVIQNLRKIQKKLESKSQKNRFLLVPQPCGDLRSRVFLLVLR
jgi:hypothetical protein